MTETTDDKWAAAQQAAESREQYEGEWKWGGQTLPLLTEAPTKGELETLEDELPDGADEMDVQAEIIDDYLVKPAVDTDAVEAPKLNALYAGMQVAWGDAVDTSELEQQMQLQGNR